MLSSTDVAGEPIPVDDGPPPSAEDHGCADAPRPSWAARPFLALIRLYQVLRAGRPSPCRYWPSCSSYAREALEVHGAAKGLALAAWRIARCNPWGGHGVDPVPQPKKASRRV
jgi:putative membrane protein insertion efficiency factor